MLCNECHRHFDLSQQDYSWVKEATISELQGLGAPVDLIRFLQVDLTSYQRFRHHGHRCVSPWVSPGVVPTFLMQEISARLTYQDFEIWREGEPKRDIKSSAQHGCAMCIRICEAVESLRYDVDKIVMESWLVLYPVTLRPKEIRILVEDNYLESHYLRFELLAPDSVFVKGLLSPSIGFSTSEQPLGVLLGSLSECMKNHSKCRDRTSFWLPSRLIDVQSVGATGRAKLVHHDEILPIRSNVEARYITLSHVWGSHKFLTLTSSNINMFRSGFSLSRLSKTFKQAMQVTQAMRLRYIWIDSLCIIQDSAEDWQIEASSMGKVYLNSFCTFAASLATSPSQGLFWRRRTDLPSPFEVEIVSTAGPARFSVFQDLQFIILNNAPLYKRGWVLQESYLSPRTLHFSKYPSFECREMFVCETYKTYASEDNAERALRLHYPTKTVSRAEPHSYSSWYTIMYNYSRCDLSVSTDKLIALCGIAKALSPSIPGGYYAGIWEKWWLEGLLWAVDQWLSGNEMAPYRPEQYRAPTWSWTSVDAPVHPWATTYEIESALVELESISTTPLRGDPFGQLSDGEIVLKGKLFGVPRFHALAEADRSELAAYAFSLDHSYQDYNKFSNKQTFFLPLAKSPDYASFDELDICGLIIQPVRQDSGRRKVFERVGFAVVSRIDGGIALANHHVDDWVHPPWPEDQLEVITIV